MGCGVLFVVHGGERLPRSRADGGGGGGGNVLSLQAFAGSLFSVVDRVSDAGTKLRNAATSCSCSC